MIYKEQNLDLILLMQKKLNFQSTQSTQSQITLVSHQDNCPQQFVIKLFAQFCKNRLSVIIIKNNVKLTLIKCKDLGLRKLFRAIIDKSLRLSMYQLFIQSFLDFTQYKSLLLQIITNHIKFRNFTVFWLKNMTIRPPFLIKYIHLQFYLKNLQQKRQLQILASGIDQPKRAFQSLSFLWSKIQFINQSTQKYQAKTTILLNIFIKNIPQRQEFSQVLLTGIFRRLQLFQGVIRNCGLIIWRSLQQILCIQDKSLFQNLPSNYLQLVIKQNNKLEINDQHFIEQREPNKITIQKNQLSEDSDCCSIQDQNQNFEIVALNILKKPQNLHDCLFALQSDNFERYKQSLKQMSNLIRNSYQLPSLYYSLFKKLLITRQFDDEFCCKMKFKCLSSILIKKPQTGSLFINQFYQTSLSLKLVLLKILKQAIKELSENPKSYQLKQQNPKKVYMIQAVRTNYTKSQNHIKKYSKNKSQVFKSSLRIQKYNPYINQLNELLDQLFFPLMNRISKLKYHQLKQQQLMIHLMNLSQQFLQSCKNCIDIQEIKQSVLDLLIITQQNCYSIQIIRQILKLIYKLCKSGILGSKKIKLIKLLQKIQGLSTQDCICRQLKQGIRLIL